MRLSDGTARVPQNRTRSERIAAKSRAAASEAPLPSTRSAAHKRDVEGCNRRICRNDDRSQWLKLTLSPKQRPRRAFQLAGVLILETSFFGTAKTIPGRGGDRYPVDGPCIRGRPGSLWAISITDVAQDGPPDPASRARPPTHKPFVEERNKSIATCAIAIFQ